MTEWSVPVIASVAAGGAVLLTAFFAGIVSVITAWRTIASKVSAIEGHVNSEKTASDGRELALRTENALLRDIIADHKLTAGLLAQAVATRSREQARESSQPSVLQQIEQHTKDTAENTAKESA